MRTRPSILIAGVIVALGSLLGSGITVQAAAVEQARRVAVEQQRDVALAKAAEKEEEVRLAREADSAIEAATPVIAAAAGKADASALASTVTSLARHDALAPAQVVSLVDAVESNIPAVQAAVAEVDRIAAERATPAGAQAFARQLMASQYGWGEDQASCLVSLWQKESGWRYEARNASSGATGIPQALPGSKMASHGADWQTNPATQISWGLDYIKRAYGTPCGAWGKSQAVGWY